jgi:hypothetical protein
MYGDLLFINTHKYSLGRIERAINACTRFVFDLRRYDHLGDRRNILLGRSLKNYFNVRVAIFYYKLLTEHFFQNFSEG